MIIQRLTAAIRRQDWFQVTIEVLIVIVGIFFGLQVQAWYEDQLERAQELSYLERMHREVLTGLNFQRVISQRVNFTDWIVNIQTNINELADALDSQQERSRLGSDHCAALASMHIYIKPTITLPTVEELLYSGQMTIIQSENIKDSLSQLMLSSEALNALVDYLDSVNVVLPQEYPELIKLNIIWLRSTFADNDFKGLECDFGAMAENGAFKNDFFESAAKQAAYVPILLEYRQRLLDLHSTIDSELNIVH